MPDSKSHAEHTQGLAIMTVFKAGFLGSARFGSGVVVARLSDGSWYDQCLSTSNPY